MMATMPAPEIPLVDVVGVGLNATDTLIRLPHFPAFKSKVEVLSTNRGAGGQVASAMVACQMWGLHTRYVGSVGDDECGEFQRKELEEAGVEAHWLVAPGANSQLAFILIDQSTGERTILWQRDKRLALRPDQLERQWVERGRLLHLDGHDAAAATQAARWARAANIPVMADMDNIYPGAEELVEQVDYLLVTAECLAKLAGEGDPVKALPFLAGRHRRPITGVTLGEQGALVWDGARFYYARGFAVDVVDTTGAGDIFHAGYIYGLLAGWDVARCLEFACGAAALNCTAAGARGGVRPVDDILRFLQTAPRHKAAFESAMLARAAAGNG